MPFKIGDWVVRTENWPYDKFGKVGIVRETRSYNGRQCYLRVEFPDGTLNPMLDHPEDYRHHLGEGDVSPWDTESILNVPYGDDYNLSVAFYWERRIDELCQNWKNDPCWELEDTADFQWARERLAVFANETKTKWANERNREIAAVASRLHIEGNQALAEYIYHLEAKLIGLQNQICVLSNE